MPSRLPFLCLIFVFAFNLNAFSQIAVLRINEFMAANRGTLMDEDEDFPDWIELYHAGEAPMNLAGYALTDDPNQPHKWLFPEVSMAPSSYLVVFASGKNRIDPNKPLHTNFSLNADGDYLALYPPENGTSPLTEWSPSFPPQREDIAYGESADRAPEFLVSGKARCKWLVPSGDSWPADWMTAEFDDSNWFTGHTGIGYDFGLDYHEWIFTEVSFDMTGFATSAYVRVPFDVKDLEGIEALRLQMRFDDGFVAYLNGIQVAASGAPENPTPNSNATSNRLPSDAIMDAIFDLSLNRDLLVEGNNILAIHGLNENAFDGDFLVYPSLVAERALDFAQPGYLLDSTPGSDNVRSYQDFVSAPVFSDIRRFVEEPFMLFLSTETTHAEIYVTVDGSIPSPTNGRLYDGSLLIDETFAVRARAFKDGCVPSPTTTHTFVFPAELVEQSVLNRSVVAANRDEMKATIVNALPIVSLSLDNEEFFGDGGIHSLPEQTREIGVSMEYFSTASPNKGFQVDAGLKIHGGDARFHPKKPFRLSFRRRYGKPKLNFPLFEGSPVTSFEQLILRAGGHDSWSISPDFGSSTFDLPFHASYLRDQFIRKSEVDLGMLSPRGKYVHLLINGIYWGVYDLHERPNAAFFADHLGGRRQDWDVLHHRDTQALPYALVDGDSEAWTAAQETVTVEVKDTASFTTLESRIDLQSLIDSLIIRMWSNDFDWAGPIIQEGEQVTFFRNKNWYAGGNLRGNEPIPFRFFAWDAEMSMGSHLLVNVFGFSIDQQVTNFDLTVVDDPGTPAGLHGSLRLLPDYQRLFGDHVQRLFFNEGILSESEAQARLQAMIDTLDGPMVLESARWGDLHFGRNFTRERHWRPEVTWLRDTFIPMRNSIFLRQLQARGLFPKVVAPVMTPSGGRLDLTNSITLGAETGDIYYTSDGSDPASTPTFSRRVLLGQGDLCHYLIPEISNGGNTLGDSWLDVDEPASIDRWRSGRLSLGYDLAVDGDFIDEIDTDVDEMNGLNTSIFIRVPFELASIDTIRSLILRMKYDDGFVAYINGKPVAKSAAPDTPTWNSAATFPRLDSESLSYQDFGIEVQEGLLHEGTNILAIHGLNGNIFSSDLLISPQLEAIDMASVSMPSESAQRYSSALTFTDNTIVKARVLDEDGRWSALTEAFFYTGAMPSASTLLLSEIHYHPTDPTADEAGFAATDFEFLELTNVGSEPIQLAGVRFTEGIDFEFSSATPALGPNQRLLIVNNREAFTKRYGQEIAKLIAGEYGATSRLSNGGETLTLMGTNGQVLFSLTYSDRAPWPSAADGTGPSLVLRNVHSPSTGDASLWDISQSAGGSPGQDEPTQPGYEDWRAANFVMNEADDEPTSDPDKDHIANLLEYAFALDPLSNNGMPNVQVIRTTDSTSIRYRVPKGLNDIHFSIETSDDLREGSWQIAETTNSRLEGDEGWDLIMHEYRNNQESSPAFFRVRLELLP